MAGLKGSSCYSDKKKKKKKKEKKKKKKKEKTEGRGSLIPNTQ